MTKKKNLAVVPASDKLTAARAPGKVVSHATEDKRAKGLFLVFGTPREPGT